MNGGHDLGGMQGLGPVAPETNEPVFHANWEKRVFALTLAAGFLGSWNIDISRHARERQHPADYIANSYYENWLAGLVKLLEEKQLVTAREVETGKPEHRTTNVRVLAASSVEETLKRGGPFNMNVDHRPTFTRGDGVRITNAHPIGHTRVPRYIRGRIGTIAKHHGAHVYPDRSADGIKEGQHVYSVQFNSRELWGLGAADNDSVFVDVWENHLEPA